VIVTFILPDSASLVCLRELSVYILDDRDVDSSGVENASPGQRCGKQQKQWMRAGTKKDTYTMAMEDLPESAEIIPVHANVRQQIHDNDILVALNVLTT